MPEARPIRPGAQRQRIERVVALTIAGVFAFNYPLLDLFSGPARWLGIPLLYLYLFVAWGALIGLIARTLEHRFGSSRED